jgi:hypothetical protein
MDLLLKENFDLKREIVFDRKKYVDLQHAYQDLKNNMQRESVSSSNRGIADTPSKSSMHGRPSAGIGARGSAKSSSYEQYQQ